MMVLSILLMYSLHYSKINKTTIVWLNKDEIRYEIGKTILFLIREGNFGGLHLKANFSVLCSALKYTPIPPIRFHGRRMLRLLQSPHSQSEMLNTWFRLSIVHLYFIKRSSHLFHCTVYIVLK
jgi:hypothetical protein